MRIPKSSTANIETEEHYGKTIILYLNMEEEENKRKCFELNRKEK